MPIIIDGCNFIRSSESDISDDESESIAAVRTLIARLEGFQETNNDHIVLVFDSTREYLENLRASL